MGYSMSDQSVTPLPRIELIISEVADGYTATVWLRTSAGNPELLTDEAVETIGQAQVLAQTFAQKRNVPQSSIVSQIKRSSLKTQGKKN